jgi:hypothetical protein
VAAAGDGVQGRLDAGLLNASRRISLWLYGTSGSLSLKTIRNSGSSFVTYG